MVEAAAAALTSLSDEPIFAKSPATAASISGAGITYDISHLLATPPPVCGFPLRSV